MSAAAPLDISNRGSNCHAVAFAALIQPLSNLGFTGAAQQHAAAFDSANSADTRGDALRALTNAVGIEDGPADFANTAQKLASACRDIGFYEFGRAILICDAPAVEGYKCLGEVQHRPGHWVAAPAGAAAAGQVRYYAHRLVCPLPWSCVCGGENDLASQRCGSCDIPAVESRVFWVCPCRLVNPGSRAACGRAACGGRNPAPAAAPAGWACGACTFENHAALPACELCGAARD
ncbi:MAG: hypothetical protein EBU54_12080 [Mycobacteriaceae bacterium]|nr:hypothetical protein [Mycobacteriaceae bacterium]